MKNEQISSCVTACAEAAPPRVDEAMRLLDRYKHLRFDVVRACMCVRVHVVCVCVSTRPCG